MLLQIPFQFLFLARSSLKRTAYSQQPFIHDNLPIFERYTYRYVRRRHHQSDFRHFAINDNNCDNNNNNNNNNTKDDDCGLPPEYNPLDRAVDIFDNVYFFGTEEALTLFRDDMAKTLQEMTVEEVYLKYTVQSGEGERGLLSMAIALRALLDPVMKYYAATTVSAEVRLAALKTIDLSGAKEFNLFEKRFPIDIPTATNILNTTTSTKRNSMNETKRSLPLGLVLGPSGSGKTFFALQYLSRKFLVDKGKDQKSVTIYFQAMDAIVEFNEVTATKAAPALIDWIKDRIRIDKRIDIPDNEPLEMHMCLIIDEAGVSSVKGLFEDKVMLTALCEAAKSLATSVAVVVLGTGLTGHSVSSSDDAYVFRMKSWQADDLAMILNRHADSLNLVKGEETTQTVAEAIFSHPKLGALATNARLAYFLVKAIARHSQYYNRLSWDSQLDEWTTTLVMEVVHQYIASNSISRLSKERKRQVAASIFRALSERTKYNTAPPNLVQVKEGDISVAEALLQNNCELVDGELRLVDGERYAFTVTPAITIVLFAMLGLPATLTHGWKAEEELAALYAVQQWCINCMEAYVSEGRYDYESIAKLDSSLEQVCVISLQKQIKSATTMADKILIPMVGPGAILRNVDNSPFADIIAPHLLIQTKREPNAGIITRVNLYDEMEKCCLLKSSNRDTRVLQGLLKMWKGKLMPTTTTHPYKEKQTRTHRNPQHSDAFPANLFCFAPPSDPVSYAVIEGNETALSAKSKKRPLPPWKVGAIITYMVSTNVDRIRLYLSSTDKIGITITQETLDNDLEINVDMLDPSDQVAWRQFLKDHVRKGIVMKFLFTKSA